MLIRRLGLLAAISFLLVLAACSGGANAAGKPSGGSATRQEVTVKALDTFRFDPPALTVRAGALVHLTLVNSGAIRHDWVVDDLDVKKIAVVAEPGRTVSEEFVPATAGTYQYYCSEPGHKEAGMVGTLTVQ